MEAELQELRDLVAQSKTDNERLWLEQAAAMPGPSTAPSISSVPPTVSHVVSHPTAQRLVFVPRDRMCPTFRGKKVGKLAPTGLQCHSSGGGTTGSEEFVS